MVLLKLAFGILVLYLSLADAWKTCQQVEFCKRLRNTVSPTSYTLLPVVVTKNSIQGNLLKGNDSSVFISVIITALENDIFRLVIDDVVPPKPPRHSVPQALDGVPNLSSSCSSERNQENVVIRNGKTKAVINLIPFKVEIYSGKKLMSILNANKRLVFEHSAPHVSVALDIRFPDAQAAYGLPLHADHLALRTTTKDDPYRLFNVDNYAYKVDSTEALYGSIPVLYAHGTTHSSGIFWLNSAQTWIDLEIDQKHADAYFMSETGIIDAFILTGPTLPESVKQYVKLTGVAPLPQYFALGYHQSRYSYMSQEEVSEVVEQFTLNNLPVDVLWLDIDYTLGKQYFTWNPVTFPDPIGLQNHLLEKKKKLVAIIDPHIKNETGYFLHDEAVKRGYYIRNPNGSIYVGECWPGPSAYLDLTNENALSYYASLYETIKTFQGKGIHVWNDMNEPAVFYTIPNEIDEYEKTIPLNSLHFNNYQHRDVHNIYGLLQTIATRKGMLARRNNTVRPFILTRSHFAGTQRYAAIWTGDNYASWEHLRMSIPMCLTESLAGISLCGADVGGFAGIPTEELYQRWYQLGAWLPFYRGHSESAVPRREPYRFSAKVKKQVMKSLNQRYAHLPTWYTLFYEHERTGEPVIRPIAYHYPKEVAAISIDTQFLIGSDILAAPVLTKEADVSRIFLPGGVNEIWYNIDQDFRSYRGKGFHNFDIDLASVPIFYRGGGIISRKDIPRSSTADTFNDPFTIYIAPNAQGFAKGRLYVDDYETCEYRNSGQYVYSELMFSEGKISLSVINTPNYRAASTISRLLILNSPKVYVQAKLQEDDVQLNVFYNIKDGTVTISNCSLILYKPFVIELS